MKMLKAKQKSAAHRTDYQSCLNYCVEVALEEGPKGAVKIYRSYPVPSSEEWSECLREEANEPSEDIENPLHLMGSYELRLLKRGLPTALGMVFGQMVAEIDAKALEAGLPAEFAVEARRLYLLGYGLSSDRANDH
jgi:hypothetical protein